MKTYVLAALSLLVVWAVVTFVIGLLLEMAFPPPVAGAWLYWLAGGIGLLAGITSFRATLKADRNGPMGRDS